MEKEFALMRDVLAVDCKGLSAGRRLRYRFTPYFVSDRSLSSGLDRRKSSL